MHFMLIGKLERQPFNHKYYTMLYASNRDRAIEYLRIYQPEDNDVIEKKRNMMEKELKQHGIKIFPNYKYETVKVKYEELKLSLSNR